MIRIPTAEIVWPKQFHLDELGVVFVWREHVLRGIFPHSKELALSYFNSGFIDKIVAESLFPRTWITDYYNENFCFVLEHERITPVLYSNEWNIAMLKDASLMVLRIAQIARKYGYNMIDCHKMNVLFMGCKPIYVDLGSFVLSDNSIKSWCPYFDYLKSYYYILDLWRMNAKKIAKRMMSPGVEINEVDYYVIKYPFYRIFGKLLYLKLLYLKTLHRLTSIPTKKIEKIMGDHLIIGKLLMLLISFVKALKIEKSQNLKVLIKKIERIDIFQTNEYCESNKRERTAIKELLNHDYGTLTFFNYRDSAFYKELLEENYCSLIISVQEEEQASINEYYSFRNSLYNVFIANYFLFNGSFQIKNKYPEKRLKSDVVIINGASYCSSVFCGRNLAYMLKETSQYSKSNKQILVVPQISEKDIKAIEEEHFYFRAKLLINNTNIFLVEQLRNENN